jgi:hypothetical protein
LSTCNLLYIKTVLFASAFEKEFTDFDLGLRSHDGDANGKTVA